MKEMITDTGQTTISVSTTLTPGFRLVAIDMIDGGEEDTVVLESRGEVEALIKALQNSIALWDANQPVN